MTNSDKHFDYELTAAYAQKLREESENEILRLEEEIEGWKDSYFQLTTENDSNCRRADRLETILMISIAVILIVASVPWLIK